MRLELVCPVCLHDAGRVEFDAAARGTCPGCSVELMVATNVQPVHGFDVPPPRQLARRVEAPPRTKVRLRRDGAKLVTWMHSWWMAPFMKRVMLAPDGYTVRTWRARGSTRLLSELRGFVALQRCLAVDCSPIQLVWISHAVWRGTDGVDLYGPMYVHSQTDCAYYCSVLNEHLAMLRRDFDPYRGQLPQPVA